MKLTKLQAARHLLDRASVLLLDVDDAISAIVLGGAAEEVLQGLLERDGKGTVAARSQLIPAMQRMHGVFAPAGQTLTDGEGHSLLRLVYNWLRHNDRIDESQAIDVDAKDEASMVVSRAMENLGQLTGEEHPRLQEVLQLSMGISAARDRSELETQEGDSRND